MPDLERSTQRELATVGARYAPGSVQTVTPTDIGAADSAAEWNRVLAHLPRLETNADGVEGDRIPECHLTWSSPPVEMTEVGYVRANDALYLASADSISDSMPVFVSADRHLVRAASAHGFSTVPRGG